jgi:hypothetical protein
MSVEQDLKELLNPLAASRVFPDLAPAAAALPRITYQQIGGESISFLERTTLPSKKNGRFQINAWAETRIEAAALALQIENTMLLTGVFQTEAQGSPVAVYEPDTKLYGTRQDFSIWSAR